MDAQKIQDALIRHVEKIALAVFVGVSGFLIYSGLSIPSFEKQPDRLKTDAQRVRAEVDVDHNAEILPERQTALVDILARTEKVVTPVNAVAYDHPKSWERIEINRSFKRRDPDLYAPTLLTAHGVVRSIAVRSKDGVYTLASLEPAEEVEKVEQKRPPRQNRRRSRMESMMGGEGGGEGGSMYGEDEGMYGGGMEDYMEMELSGGSEGMRDGVVKPVRRIDSTANRSPYTPKPLTDLKTKLPQKPVPQVARFIAGTAVLPHRQIYQSFQRALEDSSNYRPLERDTPKYFNYEIQRADVTNKSVDELTDRDWVLRRDRSYLTQLAALYWAGTAPELVPADYRDDTLTAWIPPVLFDDYSSFVLHPKIPMLSRRELETQYAVVEEMVDPTQMFSEGFEGSAVTEPTFDPLADIEAPMGGGMYGGGMYGGGFGDDYDGGYGEGGYGGYGGGGYGRPGVEADPVEYKLIRYYDFVLPGDANAPKPGRKYVYRIRVSLVDPNFPDAAALTPEARSMAPEAYARVSELQSQFDQRVAEVRAKKETVSLSSIRQFQRWTDWSEPSPVVSLPSGNDVFAGPIETNPARIINFQGREVPLYRNAHKAKAVITAFDGSLAAHIPMVIDVTEGSVLSAKAESADVIDPLTLEVRALPDAKIRSRSAVIGLEGGDPLRIVEEEEMKEPGMFLLFREDGSLDVADEVDDLQEYRIFSFAKERGE